MEYEIDTELLQQTHPVRTRQNVHASDIEPSVFDQRPAEGLTQQTALQIPEEELV
jgi:hypothetical protein